MEACHRCFEPLQRMHRTPTEALFLSRVLYCPTCKRKARFLHEWMLRALARIEWLFNFYTSCAHCGFAHVTRVVSEPGQSDDSSRLTSLKDRLRPQTYRCERCEESYRDIRPSRYFEPKPAPVAPRRLIRIRAAETVTPDASVPALLALPAHASGASVEQTDSFSEWPILRVTALDESATIATPMDATPPYAAPMDAAPTVARPMYAASSSSEPLIINVAPVTESVVVPVVERLVEPAGETAAAFADLAFADVAFTERTMQAPADTWPSLDLVRTPALLDDAASRAPSGAGTSEKASRAAAECAKLEALLAAFERHARNRPRTLPPPPARGRREAMTSTPAIPRTPSLARALDDVRMPS